MAIFPIECASSAEVLPAKKSNAEVINVCPQATQPKPIKVIKDENIPIRPELVFSTFGSL